MLAFCKRILALAGTASLLWLAGPAATPAAAAGSDLHVIAASALATVPGAATGAVYVTVHNVGATGDQLIGAATPVAERVEMHSMGIRNGVMQMRSLASIDLPVGGSIEMASGGTHLMLLGLRQALLPGRHFPLTLNFLRAGPLHVEVTVQPLGR